MCALHFLKLSCWTERCYKMTLWCWIQHFTNCPHLSLTQTIAVASNICEDGLPLDVWQTVAPDWLLLFYSVPVNYGWRSLLQSLRLFFWAGSDSHGNSELCFLMQNLHIHSTLHCDVLWLLPKPLKHNWFCLIKFNFFCELAFLNCVHLYNGWLPPHKTHQLCVATYARLVGLLTPLMLFLGCYLAWISSRAWHLPSRNLMIASKWFLGKLPSFPIFSGYSSTCSIILWDNNTSCNSMLQSNALIALNFLCTDILKKWARLD